jgi:hypothetical protein
MAFASIRYASTKDATFSTSPTSCGAYSALAATKSPLKSTRVTTSRIR